MKREIEAAFSELVETRLKELGENAFSFEQKHRLPADSVRNIIRKDSKQARPNLTRIQEICDALDFEVYIGPKRGSSAAELRQPTFEDAYVKIQLSGAELAAGAGHDSACEQPLTELAFRRDWLRSLGVSQEHAVLARVTGDSMSPTIQPRDMVLINTAEKELRPRKRQARDRRPSPIFALRDGDGARIKRLERPEEKLIILHSDNPAYPPELVHEARVADLGIIGRVVWWGHTNKEI